MSSLRPNELAALKAAQDQSPGPASGVIESDRKCLGCGYQLRGLPIGGACPECGMPTKIPETIDDPLSRMPIDVIRRLKWGCWSVFWCLALSLVLGAVYSWQFFPEALVLSALAALSMSWQVAVRFATPAVYLPQGVIRSFSRRSRLRFAARWLQSGWVIAAGASLLALTYTNTTTLTELVTDILMGGVVMGLVGLFLLAVQFEKLAEWARDAQAQKVFNWIVWGVPFAVLVLLWTPGYAILALVLDMIAAVSLLMFPVAVVMLARSIGYSVYHAVEHEMRTERQDERRERFFEKVVKPHVDARKNRPDSSGPLGPDEIRLSEPVKEREE